MEDTYKPPSILRLTDITLDDYVPVEDLADDRLLDTLAGGGDTAWREDNITGQYNAQAGEGVPESALPFDKIPATFTGLDTWPHRTNLRCWNCNFTFDDRPKFVPTFVREAEDGSIEFGVLGNMCTFNCAAAWIVVYFAGKSDQRWRAQDNLCLLYFIFTGVFVSHIRPAEPCTKLMQYGGEWDEDTYWRCMRSLDPVAGLRDHTPGSVVPERDRGPAALSILGDRASVRPLDVLAMEPLVDGLANVWSLHRRENGRLAHAVVRESSVRRGREAAEAARYESPLGRRCPWPPADPPAQVGASPSGADPAEGVSPTALDDLAPALDALLAAGSSQFDADWEELLADSPSGEVPPPEGAPKESSTTALKSSAAASKPAVAITKQPLRELPTMSRTSAGGKGTSSAKGPPKTATAKPVKAAAVSAAKPVRAPEKTAPKVVGKPSVAASKPLKSNSVPIAKTVKPAAARHTASASTLPGMTDDLAQMLEDCL
jgi:hypothetical protein